ncbi:MAG TPA: methyltransferase, partial [Gammaproteobacteria bacterium]|nr:methyltransferase [Gammaproteobacteria bacterium]
MESDQPSSATPSGTRRRRKNRTNAPTSGHLPQLPWGQPQYADAPTEPLDAEGVERVHDAAMQILEEIGIDFLHDEAREILKQAGCDVRTDS